MCPHHISDGLEDNELPCYLGRAYRSMLQVLNGERPLPIERTIQINPTEACSPDDYMDWVWRCWRQWWNERDQIKMQFAAHRRTDTAIIPALRIMDQCPITDMWHRADMRLDEPGRHAVDKVFSSAIRITYDRFRVPPEYTKKRRWC